MNPRFFLYFSREERFKKSLLMAKLSKSYVIFRPAVIFSWMQTTTTDQLYLLTYQTNWNSAGTYALDEPHFNTCCMATVEANWDPQPNSKTKSSNHKRKNCKGITLKSNWKNKDFYFMKYIILLEVKRSS